MGIPVVDFFPQGHFIDPQGHSFGNEVRLNFNAYVVLMWLFPLHFNHNANFRRIKVMNI